MKYISRDKDGKINGRFVRPQTNEPKTEERLPEDNIELKEFNQKILDGPTQDEIFAYMMEDKKLKSVVLCLNDAGAFSIDGNVLTNAQLQTAIKSKM